MRDVKFPLWLIPCGVVIHCLLIILGLSADPDNLKKLFLFRESDDSPLCRFNDTPFNRALVFVHKPLNTTTKKWKTVNSFISGINTIKKQRSIVYQCLQDLISISPGTFYFNSSRAELNDTKHPQIILYRHPNDINYNERQAIFITDISEHNETQMHLLIEKVSQAFLNVFNDTKTVFVELHHDENSLKLVLRRNVNSHDIVDISYSNTTEPCEKILYLLGISSPKPLKLPVFPYSFGISDDYDVEMAGCIAHRYSWLAGGIHNMFPSIFENRYYASSQKVSNSTKFWLNPIEKQENFNLSGFISSVSERSIQVDSNSWVIGSYLFMLIIIMSWITVLMKYNIEPAQCENETEDDAVSSSCYRVARTICNIIFAKLTIILVFLISVKVWPEFFFLLLLINLLWWHIFYCSELFYNFIRSLTRSALQIYLYKLLYCFTTCSVQVVSITLGAAYNVLFSHIIEFKLIGRAELKYKMIWLLSTALLWITLITPETDEVSLVFLQMSMMLWLAVVGSFLWYSRDSVKTCIYSTVILSCALTSVVILNMIHFSHLMLNSSHPTLINVTQVTFMICTFIPAIITDDLLLRRLALISFCCFIPFTMISFGNESLVFMVAINKFVIWVWCVFRSKHLELSHEMTAVFFLNTITIYWITLGVHSVVLVPHELSLTVEAFTVMKIVLYLFLLNCIFFTLTWMKTEKIEIVFHTILLLNNMLALFLFCVALIFNFSVYDFLSHQLIALCSLLMLLPAAAVTKSIALKSRIEIRSLKKPELCLDP